MAAQRALDKADRAAALRAYQSLLDIYRQMEDSTIEGIHRELAHDQLTQLYDALSNTAKPIIKEEPARVVEQVKSTIEPARPTLTPTPTPTYVPLPESVPSAPSKIDSISRFSSREILLVGVFVMLIGIVVFVKPEVVGFAALDTGISVPIDTTFDHSQSLSITLGAAPTSLRLTGHLTGHGVARVFHKTATGRKLVFDSTLATLSKKQDGQYFDAQCLETCAMQGTQDVELEIEVHGTSLVLDSLQYTTSKIGNHAPTWVGQLSSLSLARNTPTALNLGHLFSDQDGDSLTFIGTETPGVSITVQNEQITFIGTQEGDYQVTLIASDGTAVTRVPFKIHVQ